MSILSTAIHTVKSLNETWTHISNMAKMDSLTHICYSQISHYVCTCTHRVYGHIMQIILHAKVI